MDGDRTAAPDRGLTRFLGWFSLALGGAGALMPRRVAQLTGIDGHEGVFRGVVGARELAAGVGILRNDRPSGWLWARVFGDLLDLTMLTIALGAPRTEKGRVARVTALVAAVTALDVLAAQRTSERR